MKMSSDLEKLYYCHVYKRDDATPYYTTFFSHNYHTCLSQAHALVISYKCPFSDKQLAAAGDAWMAGETWFEIDEDTFGLGFGHVQVEIDGPVRAIGRALVEVDEAAHSRQ